MNHLNVSTVSPRCLALTNVAVNYAHSESWEISQVSQTADRSSHPPLLPIRNGAYQMPSALSATLRQISPGQNFSLSPAHVRHHEKG